MAYLLIALAVVWRVFTHSQNILPNFAPLGAIALFGGVYLKKKWAVFIPLTAMAIGDYFIGYYSLAVMLSVYSSFALIAVIGFYLKKNKTLLRIAGATLAGSLLFFMITNFAVWAAMSMYAKTFAGLIQCYVMALPFFRYTLAGDVFFVTALFGSYETVLAWERKRAITEVI